MLKVLNHLFLILILLFSLGQCRYNNKEIPNVINGEIDLRNWDFENGNPIPLNGEWEFYFSDLIFSGTKPVDPGVQKTYLRVPSSWTSSGGTSYDTFGHASYRLKLHLPPDKKLFLSSSEITSYHIKFMNGKLLPSSGNPKEEPIWNDWNYREVFPLEGEEVEIVFWVLNNRHRNAGITQSIYIGKYEDFHRIHEQKLYLDAFLFGILILISLNFFILYFNDMSEKENFYFALMTFLLSVRMLCVGENFIYLIFPGLSSELEYHIEIFSLQTIPLMVILYLQSLYPKEFSSGIYKVLQKIIWMFILISLFLPFYYLSLTVQPFNLVLVLLILSSIHSMYLTLRNDRFGGEIFTLGASLFILGTLNDILFSIRIINTGYYASYTIILFIFFQTYLLSKRVSIVYRNNRISRKIAENEEKKLRSAKNEIEVLGKLKDEFLKNLSREVHNPLTKILGYSEMISSLEVNPGIQKYNEEILQNSKKLSHHMNELLLLTDLETKISIHRSMSSINDMLLEVLMDLQEKIRNKNISINNKMNKNYFYTCDTKLWQKVLYEIISNAVEYNTIDGTIDLNVIEHENHFELCVVDSGVGIPREYINRVREKFFKIDSSKGQESSGVGLGLFLAEKIVQLHDEKLNMKSKPGLGTTVSLTHKIYIQEDEI